MAPSVDPTPQQLFDAQLESAQPDALAKIILSSSTLHERWMRDYFGESRFQRLYSLALRRQRRTRAMRGNVVVLPGIMGSELTLMQDHGTGTGRAHHRQIWLKLWRLFRGDLRYLELKGSGESGISNQTVRATGMMQKHYAALQLSLAAEWNVRAFWFDWRKGLGIAAAELASKLDEWFDDEPAHLVAHSMGGLVARTYIADFPDDWELRSNDDERGGRLIMLGTPNHGSFAVPQILTGLELSLIHI